MSVEFNLRREPRLKVASNLSKYRLSLQKCKFFDTLEYLLHSAYQLRCERQKIMKQNLALTSTINLMLKMSNACKDHRHIMLITEVY